MGDLSRPVERDLTSDSSRSHFVSRVRGICIIVYCIRRGSCDHCLTELPLATGASEIIPWSLEALSTGYNNIPILPVIYVHHRADGGRSLRPAVGTHELFRSDRSQ